MIVGSMDIDRAIAQARERIARAILRTVHFRARSRGQHNRRVRERAERMK